jgi:hypothetical protein
MNRDRTDGPTAGQVRWLDEDMAELVLLLPGRHVTGLERLAASHGLTVGRLVRLLIGEHLASAGTNGAQPAPGRPPRGAVTG